MNLALIGYGNVAKAFARMLERKRAQFPFRIVAIHTARHGTAIDPGGLPVSPKFGSPAGSVGEFLDRCGAEVVFELTPLEPSTGEPAIGHIRAAFARGMHVVTSNKGPIAHAYASLREEALRCGVQFRFEATVMDGAPVFNMARSALMGAQILGFEGVLNSTTNVIIGAMERGLSFDDGVAEARRLGVAETDIRYDVDGWDSAAKAAAIANVIMDAKTNPLEVETKGISRLTPERLADLKASGKTVRLVSRAHRGKDGLKLRVRAEVLAVNDILACVYGTSGILLFQTDLAGRIGTIALQPDTDTTAYGLLSDLIDIARTI